MIYHSGLKTVEVGTAVRGVSMSLSFR